MSTEVSAKAPEPTKQAKTKGQPRAPVNTLSSKTIQYLHEISKLNLVEFKCVELARQNLYTARQLSHKKSSKLTSEMNYDLCKGCSAKCVPGQTSRVRVKKSRKRETVVMSCASCGNVKRFKLYTK